MGLTAATSDILIQSNSDEENKWKYGDWCSEIAFEGSLVKNAVRVHVWATSYERVPGPNDTRGYRRLVGHFARREQPRAQADGDDRPRFDQSGRVQADLDIEGTIDRGRVRT